MRKAIIALLLLGIVSGGIVGIVIMGKYANRKECFSEKYQTNLCRAENNAFRPVNIQRINEKEEFEFVAENEEFRQTGFRAIVIRSKKGGIPQLALLPNHSRVDFSKIKDYRIYTYQVNYWRNASWLDSFLVAVVILK